MQVWDEEQVRLFLAQAQRFSPYYPLYLAALTTGMRQGELLGLRWQDLNLALGTASVQQTLYRLAGRCLFKAPKTALSRRTIALAPILVQVLRDLRSQHEDRRQLLGHQYVDHGLVFCQDNGKPLHANNMTRRDFVRVLSLTDLRAELLKKGVPEESLPRPLPRIRFHDLRHCHATLLLQQGVHPKIVQERLGHSTSAFTLQVYSHVMPGMQEQAVQALEARLFSDKH
jgi:integrase